MIIPDWWREETGLIYQRTLSKDDYPSSSWEVSFTRLPTKEIGQKKTKRDPKGLVNLEPECSVEWDEMILLENVELI